MTRRQLASAGQTFGIAFVLPVLFIAHCHPSSSQHVLHRRFGGLTALGDGLKTSAPAAEATSHVVAGEAIGSLTSHTVHPGSSAADAKSFFHQQSPSNPLEAPPQLLHNQPLPNREAHLLPPLGDHAELPVNTHSGFVHIDTTPAPELPKPRGYRLFDQFTSGFFVQWRKLIWVIRRLRLRSIFSRRDPRAFSYMSDLQKAFGSLPERQAQSQRVTDAIIDELLKDGSPSKKSIFKNPSQTPEALKQDLSAAMSKLQRFLKETSTTTTLQQIDSHATLIRAQLAKVHLGGAPEDNSLAKIGPKMARYHSQRLVEDQSTIERYLRREFRTRAYLADTYGFFGPNQVFRNFIQKTLSDKAVQEEFGLGGKFNVDSFMREMSNLQETLRAIAQNKIERTVAEHNRLPSPTELHSTSGKIITSEDSLLKLFEDPKDFQDFLTRFSQSKYYQPLQRELEHPQDSAGYELALVDPFGYLRDPDWIRISQLPHEKFGIVDVLGSVNILREAAPSAKDNVERRLSLMMKARDAAEPLEKIFTARGLDYLALKIKDKMKPKTN